MSGRHLTHDEIVGRVFPHEEGPAPVPMHLAVCAECQARVARIREGFLTDRGAVEGVVDALSYEFWERQAAAVMARVSEERVEPTPLRLRARLRQSVLRRPAVAIGSLAAAVLLVTGLTLLRPSPPRLEISPPVTVVAESTLPDGLSARDAADDELIRQVDLTLSREAPLNSLLPEVVP